MNKFELIKTYPRSQKLGYIFNEKEYPNSLFNQECINSINAYPEFWKEIIIKSYVPFTLITDDEKQLLEGDTYYIVNPVNYELTVQFVKEDSQASIWKKFAIRKNAKKYIKSKQKCLCMEDVLEILKEKKLIWKYIQQ